MRKQMALVFQNPYSSLDPRMTVLQIVAEPMLLNGMSMDEAAPRVAELLEMVGLEKQQMNRYPHAFSGGQRQRIGIARALALNPQFVVADEAVSALDVSVQAQILNLLQDLKESLKPTFLFIAHDLSVIEHVSDRVGVMYVGHLVELAPTEEIYLKPRHTRRRFCPPSRAWTPSTSLTAFSCPARWPTRPTCPLAAVSTRAASTARSAARRKCPSGRKYPPVTTWPATAQRSWSLLA